MVVGHVTKGGGIAGPKTLEHIVDTVLYIEGEVTLDYRLLRTTKNRFGSVDELGVFSMTEQGLVAVPNPSAVFLAARADGSAAARSLRSWRAPDRCWSRSRPSRPSRATAPAAGGHRARSQASRRVLAGLLERRAQTSFADLDVFVQVTAGVRVTGSLGPTWPWPRRCSRASTTARHRRTSSTWARSASAARSQHAERRLA